MVHKDWPETPNSASDSSDASGPVFLPPMYGDPDYWKVLTARRDKAQMLCSALKIRLRYARFKVEHGWQRQKLSEVENLHFLHSHYHKQLVKTSSTSVQKRSTTKKGRAAAASARGSELEARAHEESSTTESVASSAVVAASSSSSKRPSNKGSSISAPPAPAPALPPTPNPTPHMQPPPRCRPRSDKVESTRARGMPQSFAVLLSAVADEFCTYADAGPPLSLPHAHGDLSSALASLGAAAAVAQSGGLPVASSSRS